VVAATFYLGTHRPGWLATAQVPLFISASTINKWRGRGDDFPTRKAGTFGCGVWALDSGAYTALKESKTDRHPWHLPEDEYGGMAYRLADEIGVAPMFAAPQDWPCEAKVLARTGKTVAWHQEATTDSYLYLAEQFDGLNWAPVLQGWKPADYVAHIRQYEAAGVDLTAFRPVGLGSVCRRGQTRQIVNVVQAVQAYAQATYGRPLRLHGFGLKTVALREVGHLLDSADSLAWSITARMQEVKLEECAHRGPCNNCLRYALRWREKVLAAWSQPKQLDLGLQLVDLAAEERSTSREAFGDSGSPAASWGTSRPGAQVLSFPSPPGGPAIGAGTAAGGEDLRAAGRRLGRYNR
jgi:hypothetical protein